ncbi:MAG: MFS transporter [Candidatus Dormibacteraeota bacterium]|nr:MFS transporter [Candidatus Dormibacteraeota bacterium]
MQQDGASSMEVGIAARSGRIGVRRQLTLALFWFGISFVWGALFEVTLPFILVPEHPGPGNPTLVDPATKNTALSLMETGGLLIAMLVQPAAGAFSDHFRSRFGRRRPMLGAGALGAAASLGLVALSPFFLFLVAAYCLLQFFMNIAQGAYQGLLPDTVPTEARGRASGWLGIATLSGNVVGVVAAGPLPTRVACFVIAGVVLATALFTVVGVSEPSSLRTAAAPERSRALWRARIGPYFAEFARYPDFCWVVLSRFLIFTSLAGIQRFAAFYIDDQFRGHDTVFGLSLGSAQTATSVVLAVIVFVGILAAYPAVRLSDHVGRRAVLIGAAALGAVSFLLLFVANSLTQVVLFAIPAALCFGGVASVDWAFMADLAPRSRAGKFLGFSNVATAGAQAAAPTILGPVIDIVNAHTAPASGAPGTGGYKVLFITGAAFFLAGGLVLRRVRLQRVPEADEESPRSTRLAVT